MARLGRTVYITRDDNTVARLNPGDEVPADLAGHFVSEFETHRAFADGAPAQSVSASAAAGESGSGEQGEEQGDGYEGLDYQALKALAKQRELPQDGKAADLIARLREDDAEKAGESGSGEQGEEQSEE
jgi:hypothetical protein